MSVVEPTCDICGDPLFDSFTCYQVMNQSGVVMLLCETCYRHRPHPPTVAIFPVPVREKGVFDYADAA